MRLQHVLVSVVVAFAAVGVAPGGELPPAVINVPADTSSIQDAIDLVADGGEVIVAPGTYYTDRR